MILNGIDFLKDLNWEGRSQVSLTDLCLMERLGSVIFILLPEPWCAAWHFSRWDLRQKNAVSLSSEISKAISNTWFMKKDEPVVGKGFSPGHTHWLHRQEIYPKAAKSTAKTCIKGWVSCCVVRRGLRSPEGDKPGLLCGKKCFAPGQGVLHWGGLLVLTGAQLPAVELSHQPCDSVPLPSSQALFLPEGVTRP